MTPPLLEQMIRAMLRFSRLGLSGAVLLSLSAIGCGESSEGRAKGSPGSDAGDGSAAPPDTLSVGYARVALPWRAGAKPGQVGTNEAPAYGELLGTALPAILPIVSQDPLDPTALARDMTTWLAATLEERTRIVQPGTYNHLYEAGRGIELPPDVKAIVVRRGTEKVALVRADLYLMHEQLQRRVAELIEEETGIGRDRLFLVATHNHSAPHAVSASAGVWILAEAFDPRQFVYASHRIAEAVLEADRNLEPAELRTGVSEFRDVQRNIIGPATAEVMNPSGALETVEAGYPRDWIDPSLPMLRFDEPGGKPIVTLFLFGMHPETLPGGHGITSGEWPTHTEKKLEDRVGSPFVWMPGPLGDSEPDNGAVNPDHNFWRQGFEAMDRMTDIIAGAVEKSFEEVGKTEGDTQPRFQQLARDLPGTADFPIPTSAYLGPRLPMLRLIGDSAVHRLHTVRLGDVLLLGAPAEITTDMARNLRSRVDRVAGNVFQGHVWPGAPDWVRERIEQNFATNELEPERGAPIPMVVSHVNGYMGYIVTRWEYENRQHYRMDMTAHGPGTAEHVGGALVAMADAMDGGPAFEPELPGFRAVDLEGVNEIAGFLRGLDGRVRTMAEGFPPSDPGRVGTVVTEPSGGVAGESVTFSWVGGTNDMDPPRIVVETDAGAAVATGPSGEVTLLFDGPDAWTAVWGAASSGTFRFRVEGTYRGSAGGESAADPLWDPEGKNRPYTAVSQPFVVP